MQHPALAHWCQAKRLFRYIQYSKDTCLVYAKTTSINPPLLGWSDADWGGDVDTRPLTSSYVFTLSEGVESWQSKLQKSVAQSFIEAEYVALSMAAKEGIWIRRFLQETKICAIHSITIHCDNKSAIMMTQQHKQSERSKHIDFKVYFVRDLVEENTLEIVYTPTEEQWADFLTKPTPKLKHWNCCKNLGLI